MKSDRIIMKNKEPASAPVRPAPVRPAGGGGGGRRRQVQQAGRKYEKNDKT